MSQTEHQVMALAGVFQASILVEQLARKGQIDRDELARSIRSVLNLNPASVEDIYEGVSGIRIGLQGVRDVLSRRGAGISTEVMRYAMGILHAQRKLSRRDDLMNSLGKSLERAVEQFHYFDDPLHDSVIGAAAHCYQESVSKLSFRIRVMGNPSYLQNPRTADQVRALLLFGIRSAHLWHQQGGRRWHILFKRNALYRNAQQLLMRNTH
ncbi:high frequency lysogenization protein HflD [Saccharospirillum sp. HFRX-1]|uniref:high frequency lysogenization protein HflD n=1 Tax=unclassified Saccharospirillum TaxID=2633430 RepID=UPI003714ECC7